MKNKCLSIALAAASALTTFGLAPVHAQSTARTLTIVVPQPAGNPTDGVARKLQPLLQKELATTMIVENLPGAGGSLGHNGCSARRPMETRC